MSDHHIAVQLENVSETNAQRDRSRERSTSRSPQTRRRVARAVSEHDEDDRAEGPDSLEPAPGVDDGLLDVDKKIVPKPTNDTNGFIPSRRPSFNTFTGNGTVMIDGVETQVPDINAYQHKKNLAQGMMDLALLTANANQLRYVLETYRRHPYFYPSLLFISMSIIFQVCVGVGLILNGQYNVNDPKERCKANRINNLTVIGIFIITVVNVFISAFGVADPPST